MTAGIGSGSILRRGEFTRALRQVKMAGVRRVQLSVGRFVTLRHAGNVETASIPRRALMRTAITTLSCAGVISLACWHSAGAVPADAAAVKEAAAAISTVQQARYHRHHTRHAFTKCYYVLVIGPYVCHRFHRLWW